MNGDTSTNDCVFAMLARAVDAGKGLFVQQAHHAVALGHRTQDDMRHHILSLFRQEGVDIPYPQMDVRFPAAPERGGAVPKPPKPKAEGNASAS